MIVSHWNGKVSIKKGRLRLGNDGKLYDVEADPGQQHDVSQKHAVDYKRMNTVLGYYKEQVLPGYDDNRRPFVIAHPDSQNTQIPARDGKEHGGIKRSNRFPNSSYFTNWTSIEDSITWNAEILTSGTYEVELFYTCPQGDEGSTVQLSFNNDQLSGTVNAAAPAVIIGAAEDRVKRSESYEQNWSRQILGDIKLTAGSGTLTLAATKIPGSSVMDFRLMMLRRK